MNLNNLSVGMKLGSYKALCQTLDVPVQAGNSKVAQLKEFERYFSYARQGNSYTIQEIYDIPKQTSDGRQKYIHLIEPLLLHLLGTDPSFQSYGITWSRWYRTLGLTTDRFYNEKERQDTLEYYDIGAYTMYLAANLVSRKCHEILLSSLATMKRKGLIDYEEHWYIVAKNGFSHNATEGEERGIMRMRNLALEELGYSSMQQVFLSPKRYEEYDKRFHEIVSSGLWRNVYKALRIKSVGDVCQKYATIDPLPLKEELRRELVKTVKGAAYKHEENSWEKELDTWANSFEDPSLDVKKSFSLPHGFGHNTALILDALLSS